MVVVAGVAGSWCVVELVDGVFHRRWRFLVAFCLAGVFSDGGA